MKLVVAEKPSVGAALAKAFGACEKRKGYTGTVIVLSRLFIYEIYFTYTYIRNFDIPLSSF